MNRKLVGSRAHFTPLLTLPGGLDTQLIRRHPPFLLLTQADLSKSPSKLIHITASSHITHSAFRQLQLLVMILDHTIRDTIPLLLLGFAKAFPYLGQKKLVRAWVAFVNEKMGGMVPECSEGREVRSRRCRWFAFGTACTICGHNW